MYTTSTRRIFSLMYKLQQWYGGFSIAGFLKPVLGVLDLFRRKPARQISSCLQEWGFFVCVHTYAHGEFFWYTFPLTVNYRSETSIFLFFLRVQEKKKMRLDAHFTSSAILITELSLMKEWCRFVLLYTLPNLMWHILSL